MHQLRRIAIVIVVSAVSVSLVMGYPSRGALASTPTGYLRVGHFVPGTPAVAVSLDAQPLVGALSFQQVTSYVAVPAGAHILKFAVPAAAGAPAHNDSATETIGTGQFLTVLITTGASGSLTISSFTDNLSQPGPGDAKVRFIDTLSTLPILAGSLTMVPGHADPPPVVVPGTPEGQASPYLNVPANAYNVDFTNARTGATVLTGKDWPVEAGTVASLVVLQGGSGPTLEVLKDAVGASSVPAGGMQTGAGGMALRSHPTDLGGLWLGLGLLVTVLVAGSVVARRTRRPVGLMAVACATGLVATSCGSQASLRATSPPTTTAGETGWSPPVPPTIVRPSSVPPSISLAAAGTADPSNQPLRIAAPSVGIDAQVVNLGRLPNGTMQVPSDFSVAGWYDAGPPPGAPGPAVIIGHVDSTTGPAVFWRLRDLRPGDNVTVTSANGTETFQVTSIQSVPKDTFPTEMVFGPVSDPELRLITCSGEFDRSTGHYLDNTIVFAHQIAG